MGLDQRRLVSAFTARGLDRRGRARIIIRLTP
jgi:hypothetical protein